MNQPARAVLLTAAALMMIFGAVGYTTVVLPDLHGDLVEIGVRPSVLGATVLHLYFAAIAMFGFALIVLAAAVQTIRGGVPARMPLAIITIIYTSFGTYAFSRSHNPHHLGPAVMGLLLGIALAIPIRFEAMRSRSRSGTSSGTA
jgi:hypothetical protein